MNDETPDIVNDATPGGAPDETPENTPEPEARKRDSRTLRIWIGVGVVLLVVGLWLVTLVPGWLARDPTQPTPAPTAEVTSARKIQATLYYVSDDGSELVTASRDVPYAAAPAEQAKQIVAAQLQPPPAGFVSAIPPGTIVRAVFLGSKGEAYVDLSPQIRQMPVAGSLDEALAVFAIVNAVTTNLRDVTSVQILVDGKEVDSLAGHIDLREPIARSDAWVKKGQ